MSAPDPITRLTRDLKEGARTLSTAEARFLVDGYYTMQEYRKAAGNQILSMTKSGEPHDVLKWLFDQHETMEQQIKRALDRWSDEQPLGKWAKAQVGIGAVLASGLLAHIDIAKAPTVGHIWRFAGLDPTVSWDKGQKRPWNASLKTLCWKIGESFVKQSGNPNCFYGRIYTERKDIELRGNSENKFAGQAAAILEKRKIGKDTDAFKAYTVGQLPPAHIHARAKRHAVKLFLSAYHEVGYRLLYNCAPPLPYPIAHLGHAHVIPVPEVA
jgi:hypothetical protein